VRGRKARAYQETSQPAQRVFFIQASDSSDAVRDHPTSTISVTHLHRPEADGWINQNPLRGLTGYTHRHNDHPVRTGPITSKEPDANVDHLSVLCVSAVV
jgi:hypothetical protein